MLVRYIKNQKGKLVKQACVYVQEEHGITSKDIDKEARAICDRLRNAGFETYIVGGAVRDLLLSRTPKDYDIATSAHPAKVKRIFGFARIIGRRFKLVHVISPSKRIFEVATFRSLSSEPDQIYGTLEEDAFRRDFTLNALYYDTKKEQIIDFHGGVIDIKKRIVKPVVPLSYSFEEDPVRMLRAIKYARATNSKLSGKLKAAIKKNAKLLAGCSYSRLSEELIKVLASGASQAILQECYDFGLLNSWMPALTGYMAASNKNERTKFWQALETMDALTEKSRGRMLHALLSPYVRAVSSLQEGLAEETIKTMKLALAPIIVPNRDLIEAARLMYAEEGISWRKLENFYEQQRTPRRKRHTGKPKS